MNLTQQQKKILHLLEDGDSAMNVTNPQTPNTGAGLPSFTPPGKNAPQGQQQGQEQQKKIGLPQNGVEMLQKLKDMGVDTSDPVVAQVANKLPPVEADKMFTQLLAAINDPKSLSTSLTNLLSLSTEIKNFSNIANILTTLSKADTTDTKIQK